MRARTTCPVLPRTPPHKFITTIISGFRNLGNHWSDGIGVFLFDESGRAVGDFASMTRYGIALRGHLQDSEPSKYIVDTN